MSHSRGKTYEPALYPRLLCQKLAVFGSESHHNKLNFLVQHHLIILHGVAQQIAIFQSLIIAIECLCRR